MDLGPFGEHVTGDLFAEKLVVGLVGVERGDDVIAVVPGVGAKLVALEAVGIGVVRDVEPVARPALAVVRAGEEAVHESGDSAVLTFPLSRFLTFSDGRRDSGRVRK